MRVKTTVSKNSVSIYIIKSFRDNGKNTSKIVEKLGNLNDLMKTMNCNEDEVMVWAKQRALKLTQDESESLRKIIVPYSPTLIIDKNVQTSFSGGYLFLQDIFYDLKLDKICNSIQDKYKFEFNLTDILSRLIYSRILSPSSKLSTFESSKHFIEASNFELQHIYRALDVISKESDYIQSEVYKNSKKMMNRNTSILYYDCTNYFFEIEEESGIKQYGKSKENRPNPIVQMGLFMDGDGVPLAFSIDSGNRNEQKTLIPLENKIISDFELSKFVVCTDAGLGSKENRVFNNSKQRSYIVTQSIKKLKSHIKEWSLNPEGFKLLGSELEYDITKDINETNKHHTFYKERWINEGGLEQRLIVTYSHKYKVYQENIRSKQIGRAEKMVDKNQSISHRNQNSPTRFINERKITENGEIAEETILCMNQQAIENETLYDGLYAVCTTLEDSVQEIIKINHRRWEIEESFRIMKTDFKARPVYLKRDERILAHFNTCFLSLLIYRILEKKLNEKYSTTEIITTLKKFNFTKIRGEGYIPNYMRTDLTDNLHSIFGFRTDTEIVTDKKIKEISKLTKS